MNVEGTTIWIQEVESRQERQPRKCPEHIFETWKMEDGIKLNHYLFAHGVKNVVRPLLFLTFILLSSCTDNQDADTFQVKIDNQISQHIQIISTSGTRAGKVNPIEVQISLKNISKSPQQILLEAQWLDSRGGFNGGSQRVLKLAAGQTETILEGTRSNRVTRYQAMLKATEKSQGQLLSETLASNKVQIAKGYGMTFSETPATEKIPNLPIRGVANGAPFDAKTLTFRTDDKGQWTLEISDRSFDPIKGIAMERSDHPDVQTIYIKLPATPTKDKTFQQKMQYGGGMFQIKPKGDSQSTTSWNTSLAYKIEISDWQKGESTHFSCGRPKTGKASGKLYISFMGGSESRIKNSWISGAFNDATVLYCNDS